MAEKLSFVRFEGPTSVHLPIIKIMKRIDAIYFIRHFHQKYHRLHKKVTLTCALFSPEFHVKYPSDAHESDRRRRTSRKAQNINPATTESAYPRYFAKGYTGPWE